MPKQKKVTKIVKKVKRTASRPKVKAEAEGDFSLVSSNKENPLFCTECDKELDTFWRSSKSKNPEAVKNNHRNCRKTGKFKGEFCSKLFIIDKDILEGIWEDKEE